MPSGRCGPPVIGSSKPRSSTPDREFVVTEDRTLTYRETLEWARSIAKGLIALGGLRPGEHVGLLMANEVEFIPVKFAVALAGAVAVPMNFLYREHELATSSSSPK